MFLRVPFPHFNFTETKVSTYEYGEPLGDELY